MSLISLVLVLVVIGVLLYVVETLIPMDVRIKRVIEVIVCIAVLFYILQAFGLISNSPVHLR